MSHNGAQCPTFSNRGQGLGLNELHSPAPVQVPVHPRASAHTTPPASFLRELHIQNLAVISDARIELAPGLNCFTGATGAGKSLVIGALEVLLGLRAPGELLRKGSDEGRVSAVFDISDPAIIANIESITDVPLPVSDAADEGKSTATTEILLTRRLFASGRSSISLNGHPITLSMLRAASQHLVDVHGQHDQQFLLKTSNQLDVLDAYADVRGVSKKYQAVYHELTESRRRLDELSSGRALRQQQLELYRFQVGEIDAADLQAGELDSLQSRARVLGNVERLQREVGGVYANLYEADSSLVEQMKAMASSLGALAELDVGLKGIASAIKDAAVTAEESAYDLRRYLDRLELDPEELNEVNERLTTLGKLASKYAGRTIDGLPAPDESDELSSVLRYREELRTEIARLERQSEDLGDSQAKLAPLTAEARKLATELSTARRRSAARLGKEVESALAELGMERARFEIHIESTPLSPPESTPASPSHNPTQTLGHPASPTATPPGSATRPGSRVDIRAETRPETYAETYAQTRHESRADIRAQASPETDAETRHEIRTPSLNSTTSRPLAAPADAALPALTSTGIDIVEFMATTNPGLAASPLRKIASGGELSRIMLALKGILASGDRVSVLVFDEIDSNVGGRLGAVIGTKLRQLARGHQVLCITHLPQIASYADRHLTVSKSQSKDETTSIVRAMEGEARLTEIAEMIGGPHITETTRAQARELLQSASTVS